MIKNLVAFPSEFVFPHFIGMKWLYFSGHTETRTIVHLKRCVRWGNW
jgi:hypothetical protein